MELWESLSFYIPLYCLNLLLKSKPFYNRDKKMVHFDKQSRKYTKFKNKLKFKPKLLQHNLEFYVRCQCAQGTCLGQQKCTISWLRSYSHRCTYLPELTKAHTDICAFCFVFRGEQEGSPHYHMSCSRFPTFGEIPGSAHRAQWKNLAWENHLCDHGISPPGKY